MNIRKKIQILALAVGMSFSGIAQVKADWLSDKNKIRLGQGLHNLQAISVVGVLGSIVNDAFNSKEIESKLGSPNLSWDYFMKVLYNYPTMRVFLAFFGIMELYKLYNYFVMEKLRVKLKKEKAALVVQKHRLHQKSYRLLADQAKEVARGDDAIQRRLAVPQISAEEDTTWINVGKDADANVDRIDQKFDSTVNKYGRSSRKLRGVNRNLEDIDRLPR